MGKSSQDDTEICAKAWKQKFHFHCWLTYVLPLYFIESPQRSWTHFYYSNNFPLKPPLHIYLQPSTAAYKQNAQLFPRREEKVVVLLKYGSASRKLSFLAVFGHLVSPSSSGLLGSEGPSLSSSEPSGGSGTSTWSLQSLFSFLSFYQLHFSLLQNLKDCIFPGFCERLFWVYFWYTAASSYAPPLVWVSCQPQHFLLTFWFSCFPV